MASTRPTSPRTARVPRPAGAPRIWAVGGGKGGVGKSVVALNLAAAIAGAGRRCALIDADLGAANLHTLLGVPRPLRTLAHFLGGEVDSLADLMVQSSVPNLWLVSGSQALLDMANPNHGQKQRLLRHVRRLAVDHVVLDLSAGSAFNALDFFLLARRGLVVVTPEPTAIDNAEHFIGAAFHRWLGGAGRHPAVRGAILRIREDRRVRRLRSARELIAQVRRFDPAAADLLEERARWFAPLLLVNRVQSAEQRGVGRELVTSLRERLGAAVELAGSLEDDAGVPEAVARRRPTLQLFPGCRFSRHLEALARRLLHEDGEAAPAGAVAPDLAALGSSLPPLDRSEPGTYLRRCRERLGLSLEEMTARTRIRNLDHIERQQFELLPPEPYLKGFVLEYAKELGVPELEDFTARYLGRCRSGGATSRADLDERGVLARLDVDLHGS